MITSVQFYLKIENCVHKILHSAHKLELFSTTVQDVIYIPVCRFLLIQKVLVNRRHKQIIKVE